VFTAMCESRQDWTCAAWGVLGVGNELPQQHARPALAQNHFVSAPHTPAKTEWAVGKTITDRGYFWVFSGDTRNGSTALRPTRRENRPTTKTLTSCRTRGL